MNPEKVGKFIKELRKNNNLTQKELADRYGVTYQAVSKWENGINLPEISLLRKMSKDFNISISDILDGEVSNKKKKNRIIIIILILLIIIAVGLFINKKRSDSFKFKTISTTCEEFKVSGSLAYDKEKTSIYISNIDYCGGDDETNYEEIECTLYEKDKDINKKISSCKTSKGNIKLEDYLKEVKLNIDNYSKTCKNFNDDSLFLEVNAKETSGKIKTYKIPLSLNNNCPN